MEKCEKKQRFTLTLLLSIIIFFILLTSLVLSVFIIHFFIRYGIIDVTGPGSDHSAGGQISVNYILLIAAIISLIIAAILSFLTSKIPLKPINLIIDQMNRLAAGDFSTRLKFSSALSFIPAFTEVSESFNKMAEELQNTELLREDFINNFSHEFKTPIVSIAGFAKLLRRGNLTAEQQAEYLAVIEEESMRLSAMATNVLNMTKVENQTILTDISVFNVSEQIRSAVLLLEDKWAKKDIGFDMEFGEYRISANEELLKQVWINLIDNAIKFSPVGGCVAIHVSESEGKIHASVINRGIAISKENQTKIFRKFFQADESHASEGNGIGLAVVKRIVDLHHGNITVQCTGGSTMFMVELPAEQI